MSDKCKVCGNSPAGSCHAAERKTDRCRAVFDGEECEEAKRGHAPCNCDVAPRAPKVGCHPFDDGTSCAEAIKEDDGAPSAAPRDEQDTVTAAMMFDFQRVYEESHPAMRGQLRLESIKQGLIAALSASLAKPAREGGTNDVSQALEHPVATDAGQRIDNSRRAEGDTSAAPLSGTNEPLLTDEQIEATYPDWAYDGPNAASAAKWARDTITKRIQERREA